MARVSVVSVSLNNSVGLEKTLSSLSALITKPYEVIIIDGGSKDETYSVVEKFRSYLPLKFTSEPDSGIYDAMNRGLRSCTGDFIHYLNAGDTVFGEPYLNIHVPSKIRVMLEYPNGKKCPAKESRLWPGYCHQGLIFPVGHPEYDCSFGICADLELIIKLFGSASRIPSAQNDGGVIYDMSGLSSRRLFRRDFEQLQIFYRHGRPFNLVWQALKSVSRIWVESFHRFGRF